MKAIIINNLSKPDNIINFFSVIEGFRDIGTINTNKPSIIRNFLKNNYPNYLISISRVDGVYFVYHEKSELKIKNFLINFPDPINNDKGQYELGLLLGYPKCCVKSHIKGNNNIRKINTFVPFRPCTPGHDKIRASKYDEIGIKLGIDIHNKPSDIIYKEAIGIDLAMNMPYINIAKIINDMKNMTFDEKTIKIQPTYSQDKYQKLEFNKVLKLWKELIKENQFNYKIETERFLIKIKKKR